MDYKDFINVLKDLMSPDNSLRTLANASYQNFKDQKPQELIQCLMQCLNVETDDNTKLQCAVLLRNLTKETSNKNSFSWDKLAPEIQNQIRDELFKTLVQQADEKVRNNICDIISGIAHQSDSYMEKTVSKIFELINSNQPNHQRSALRIFGDTLSLMVNFVQQNLQLINSVIEKCMDSPDIQLRYECLGFLVNLLNKQVPASKITNCMPVILQTLDSMVQVDHALLPDYLQFLIGVAEAKAEYFKRESSSLLDRLTTLAMNNLVDESNRPLALEVLLCIAESKPIFARKIPNFIERVIEVILHFMLDIKEKKYEHWLETGDDQDIEDNFIYYIGEEAIDRFAKAFQDDEKNANFLPTVFRYLRQFLENPEWQFNYVGIMTISQIAEYFPEDNSGADLNDIMQLLINKLQDKDWRVRFAACQAIGQISLDHQPYVQETFHPKVLPALISTLNDPSPRVQAHALAAFINFAEEVSSSALTPHVEYVIQHLVSRITNQTSNLVREQAVSAIAVIAGVIGEDFMKYSNIMPLIMDIIEQCTKKNEQTLRGKAIECISIIGISVGQEKFQGYSSVSMDALIQLSDQGFEDDDPVREFVQQSMTRMCRLMEENVLPYLSKLLPPLLEILSNRSHDIFSDKNISGESPEDLLEPETYMMETSLMQDQEHALEFIKTAAEVLKAKFVDYLQPCAFSILKYLDDIMSYGFKVQALSAMASLIEAAKAISEVTGDKSLVCYMLTETTERILKRIDSLGKENTWERDLDLMISEVNGLDECINKAGSGVLPVNMIKLYTERIFELLRHSFDRRDSDNKQMESEDCEDEDEYHKLAKDLDLELDLSISLLDLIGSLMQHHKHEFFNSSIEMCTEFIQSCRHLGTNGNNGAILLATLICSDILEHLSELSVPLWVNLLLPLTFACLNLDDGRIRQSANFSLGRAAQLPDFRPFANEAIKSLWSTASNYTKMTDDLNKVATDNAIASLGDIVFNHYDVIERPEYYVQEYLAYLPLKDDEIEGKRVHKELMDRFRKSDPKLIEPEGVFKKKILIIFVEIYKTSFSTQELDILIAHLISELGHQNLEFLFPNPNKTQINQLNILSADIMANNPQ